MSTSTIFIKRPLSYKQSLALIREKYREISPVLSVVMWALTGLYAAARSHFNTNITGVALAFPVYQLLITLVASVLACRGLSNKSIIFLIPYICVSIYSLYFNHYLGIMGTLTAMKTVKRLTWLPWSNLCVNMLLLIIRVTLTVRIFQLCIHLWVKQKLCEIKEKLY